MIVAGSMIGSGIFIVAGEMAREVGSAGWMLVAWLIAGILTLTAALSYGELAAMMPHAGGQYVFLREAYSPLWGFLYGWTGFLVIQTGTIAAVAVAFGKFLGVIVPALGTTNVLYRVENLDWVVRLPVPWLGESVEFFKRSEFTISAGQLVGAGIVVVLSLLNSRGVRLGAWVQNLFTVAKTGGLVALIVIGLTVAVDPRAVAINREHV